MLDVRCFIFLAFLALAPDSFSAPPAGYYLMWSDEFNPGGYGASFTATHPPDARSRVGVGF
jgi:hypothetical protein